MLANRFMATFRDDITSWNRKLNAVADVVQLLAEIQRSWACESCVKEEEEEGIELNWALCGWAAKRCDWLPFLCCLSSGPSHCGCLLL